MSQTQVERLLIKDKSALIFDSWRHTGIIQLSGTTGATALSTNWERVDDAETATIGGNMTESSGIFTFPQTGIYLVELYTQWYQNGAESAFNGTYIHVTADNSSYTSLSSYWCYIPNVSSAYSSTAQSAIVDVTSTTNVKIKFLYQSAGAVKIGGDSNSNHTHANFIYLGDT
jgi:hypothetical protein